MSQIIILGGTGGGGADLENVTATRNQALTTAMTYFDVGAEEPALTNGTMKDFSAQTTRPLNASVELSTEGIASGKLTNSEGINETGFYTEATKFEIDISGNENLGNATAAMVLAGQTFTSANGIKLTGTLATYNGEIE